MFTPDLNPGNYETGHGGFTVKDDAVLAKCRPYLITGAMLLSTGVEQISAIGTTNRERADYLHDRLVKLQKEFFVRHYLLGIN
jgi:hypothetical protein